MIRFHLDENVDGAVARGLRDRGFDVTVAIDVGLLAASDPSAEVQVGCGRLVAIDVGLLAASDPEHLSFAAAENRVVFTHDADFLRLHASGTSHAGIVYCRPLALKIGEIVHGLLLIASCLNSGEFRDHVEFL